MVADDVTRCLLAAYETGRLTKRCSWCGRVEVADDWQLAPRLAIIAIDASTVSHAMCPDCALALSTPRGS
jgi:hypothetical protein